MKDFYYILGIEKNATAAEVREAYRKLSKKFHPDLNSNDYYFENRFKDIREAYETLNDPTARKRYDSGLSKEKATPNQLNEKPSILSKTKWVDLVFSLMLLILTTVFGNYVYRAVYSVKPVKHNKLVAAVEPKIIRHKKKRLTKINANNNLAALHSSVVNEPKIAAEKSIPPAPIAATPILPMAVIKPKVSGDTVIKRSKQGLILSNTVKYVNQPVLTNNIPINNAAAYIKANATGVVYLRALDNYNSDVVTTIPDNSKIAVLEKGNTFYKVSFNNKTGYVPKWTVKGN